MKRIVLSGINIDSGGMLSVYKDAIRELLQFDSNNEIIALVHKKELFQEFSTKISLIELPKSKKSWIYRCYYEYVYLKKLSKNIKADIWISMHDMTPNVIAGKQFVYCHNPAPFFSIQKNELFIDWKITSFVLFYRYLYQINIRKNRYVIVQQEWLRRKFQEIYHIDNVIVARPILKLKQVDNRNVEHGMFIYPTFPRMYKNLEVICDAFKMIEDIDATVYLTIDGTENKYANDIVKKYGTVKGIKFVGLCTREEVMDYYARADGLIFPSRLESWGMPLSEFAVTKKKIIAADLPYARENLNGYKNAKFFEPTNAGELSSIIRRYMLDEEFISDVNDFQVDTRRYAKDWQALYQYLLNDKEDKN